MPVTICDATREGSTDIFDNSRTSSNPYIESTMNKALPKATRKWVRKPAALPLYSRSSPIRPPSTPAMNMRKTRSIIYNYWLLLLEEIA